MNGLQDTSQLLALLQLNDSAFPSGAFTHSYGLEQLVRQGVMRTAQDVEGFVASVLTHTTATSEAAAARQATVAATGGDITSVLATDRALHAMKQASELRQASLMTGRRFLEEVAIHTESPILDAYRDEVASDVRLGNYAVAFGVVAAALDIESRFVPGAVLLSSATAILQSAMRLMRVSHRDVQGILHRLRPLVARLAGEVLRGRTSVALSGFHPLQDIASMRHANAEARLFAS